MKIRRGWKVVFVISGLAAMAAACAGMRTGYSSSETAALGKAALVYLANDNLTADIPQPVTQYTKVEAGDSQRIARSFTAAPPQVPHDIEGLLPIDLAENACLACHLPEHAGDQDIPIPKSHFSRPQIDIALLRATGTPSDGGMLSYVAGYTAGEELTGARYNCVQCHTPQAENVAGDANIAKSNPQ